MHRITAIAVALGFALPARAQDPVMQLADEILVTATRFNEDARDLPVNSTVITREEIARSPATTLPEILAQHAGIGMRDLFGNNASDSTIDLRGFGAAAGQNTLVLVDGRMLNDIDLSGVVWSSIPLSAIERIEIIRGGASVLHGAGAVGGLVNIITRSPSGPAGPSRTRGASGQLSQQRLAGVRQPERGKCGRDPGGQSLPLGRLA